MMDRVFDNYVMNVMVVVVANALRPEEHRDFYGIERARIDLGQGYAWLDGRLAGRDRAWPLPTPQLVPQRTAAMVVGASASTIAGRARTMAALLAGCEPGLRTGSQ